MAYRIAINGFGRIGRLTMRSILNNTSERNTKLEIVAINDLTDNATLAHLFKYDTAQGTFSGNVSSDDDSITIDGHKIVALSERDPSKLPWGDLNVDVVLECTGIFREKEKAQWHIDAGAKKVLISAPGKGGVKTIVQGINEDELTTSDVIISNASCTTNCLAPMAKVLHENFGIKQGIFTTIHAYTSDQRIQDAPHKDLRRARAAAQNIVPTSTGAAAAVAKVYPAVDGKLTGMAARVPIITGSLTDLNCYLEKTVSAEEINEAFKTAANGSLKGYLEYSTAPLVSSDIIGNTHSCIFDAPSTIVLGNMVKIIGWYDNEMGYASRLADLAARLASLS